MLKYNCLKELSWENAFTEDTEYIHIGCDEVFYYIKCDELRKQLPDYFRKLKMMLCVKVNDR